MVDILAIGATTKGPNVNVNAATGTSGFDHLAGPVKSNKQQQIRWQKTSKALLNPFLAQFSPGKEQHMWPSLH